MNIEHNLDQQRLWRNTVVCIFVCLGAWWWFVFFREHSADLQQNLWWAASYQILAIFGSACGYVSFKRWGGFKSTLGKSIFFFATGLALQALGQSVFSFYNLFLRVDVPYPSFADVGFFLSIPAYIYGVVLLGSACGVSYFKSWLHKTLVVLIPVAMVIFSYRFFLEGYVFDWSHSLRIFLDFGYPFGQALYISLAVVVYIFSRRFLGGVLRRSILLILTALVIQYSADYNFLYQAAQSSWINGGYGDFIYTVSYFAMGLISLGSMFERVRFETLTQGAVRLDDFLEAEKILNQILVEIIKRQEKVMGDLIWSELEKIPGVEIRSKERYIVAMNGDQKEILNRLVVRLNELFGTIAVDVSRNAARFLIADLPIGMVPENLK